LSTVDSAGVQHGPAGVAARVDTRHDRVRRRAEAAEPRRHHRQPRWPVDAVDRHAFEVVERRCADADAFAGVDRPDGGAAATAVFERRRDHDVVAEIDYGSGQRDQPGGADAIVVRDEDARHAGAIIRSGR
jgi:hypothetical protein